MVRAVAEEMVFPLKLVMATEPESTWETTAPEELALLPDPPEVPKLPDPVLPDPVLFEEFPTPTPRKAVGPMWMVELAWPASIFLATERAVPIGMA